MLALGLLATLALPACKGKDSPTGPSQLISRSSLLPATTDRVLESVASQSISSGFQYQAFDDFTFTGAGTIRTVEWQGAYCVPVAGSPAPTPTATAFRISFYADSAGRPRLSAPISQATYPVAQVAETLDRTLGSLFCFDSFTSRSATNVTFGLYRYRATLATPLAAVATTRYWILVQAITPSTSTIWGWRDGTADNGSSLRYANNAFAAASIYDRAFALTP